MLQTSETESEILLGNKQLLGIFFVIVVLLAVAFAGGYKLGQASKKGAAAAPADTVASAPAPDAGVQTHDVAPNSAPDQPTTPQSETSEAAESARNAAATETLGAPKHGKAAPVQERATPKTEEPAPVESRAGFAPEPGQMFLQVAAVGRDEAEAVADVLHRKGFRAHAVPKPGNPKIYRVLIGPMRDAGDLSSTRDSLRRTGFREVITQRY